MLVKLTPGWKRLLDISDLAYFAAPTVTTKFFFTVITFLRKKTFRLIFCFVLEGSGFNRREN